MTSELTLSRRSDAEVGQSRNAEVSVTAPSFLIQTEQHEGGERFEQQVHDRHPGKVVSRTTTIQCRPFSLLSVTHSAVADLGI